MSQDPLGFDAGDSNLYRYVNNVPTDVVDPSGLQLTITVIKSGTGVKTGSGTNLGFNVSNNGVRFGFKATVEGDDAKSIAMTSIKQEVMSLAAYKFVDKNGTVDWEYNVMDKNHKKNTTVTYKVWNDPFEAWVKDGAVNWLTLDVDAKTGEKVDGTPAEIMKVYSASELKGKDFSWSDIPSISAKTLNTPELEEVSFYRTFRITATCGDNSTVAVFSVRQDATNRSGNWIATKATKNGYARNDTWPNLPHTWPDR